MWWMSHPGSSQAKDKTGGVSADVTSAAKAALDQERRRPDVRAPTKDEEDYFGEVPPSTDLNVALQTSTLLF